MSIFLLKAPRNSVIQWVHSSHSIHSDSSKGWAKNTR